MQVVVVGPGHVGSVCPACLVRRDRTLLHERVGGYDRKRFLETMAWECSAGEPLRAYQTLCGSERNA